MCRNTRFDNSSSILQGALAAVEASAGGAGSNNTMATASQLLQVVDAAKPKKLTPADVIDMLCAATEKQLKDIRYREKELRDFRTSIDIPLWMATVAAAIGLDKLKAKKVLDFMFGPLVYSYCLDELGYDDIGYNCESNVLAAPMLTSDKADSGKEIEAVVNSIAGLPKDVRLKFIEQQFSSHVSIYANHFVLALHRCEDNRHEVIGHLTGLMNQLPEEQRVKILGDILSCRFDFSYGGSFSNHFNSTDCPTVFMVIAMQDFAMLQLIFDECINLLPDNLKLPLLMRILSQQQSGNQESYRHWYRHWYNLFLFVVKAIEDSEGSNRKLKVVGFLIQLIDSLPVDNKVKLLGNMLFDPKHDVFISLYKDDKGVFDLIHACICELPVVARKELLRSRLCRDLPAKKVELPIVIIQSVGQGEATYCIDVRAIAQLGVHFFRFLNDEKCKEGFDQAQQLLWQGLYEWITPRRFTSPMQRAAIVQWFRESASADEKAFLAKRIPNTVLYKRCTASVVTSLVSVLASTGCAGQQTTVAATSGGGGEPSTSR